MKRLDLHVHAKLAAPLPLQPEHLLRQLRAARLGGLDGIALTEHFHAAGFWEIFALLDEWFPCRQGVYTAGESLRVVAGAELSLREGGHLILLGEPDRLRRLDGAFPAPLSAGYRPAFSRLVELAEGLGLLVVGAHIFRRGKGLHRLPAREISRLAALEVNGKDREAEERRLVARARERDLAVTGGSDAHHWLQVGVRYTLLPIPEITLGAVGKALASRATWYATAPAARLRVRLARMARRWGRRQWKRDHRPPVVSPDPIPSR